MTPALLTAKSKTTRQWFVDRKGYVEVTNDIPAYFDQHERPIDLEKYEVKEAQVTDGNWQIQTPPTPAQP